MPPLISNQNKGRMCEFCVIFFPLFPSETCWRMITVTESQPGLVMERVKLEYHGFLTAGAQLLVAFIWTCFYKEWWCSCMVTKWMDRTGYSPQLCRVPPTFMGIKKENLFSREKMDFLLRIPVTIQVVIQAMSVVLILDRQKEVLLHIFLVRLCKKFCGSC